MHCLLIGVSDAWTAPQFLCVYSASRCPRRDVIDEHSPCLCTRMVEFVAIPTVPGGGNHTKEFEAAAATDTAHEACYTMSKALAHVGMRVITDEAFLAQVGASYRTDSLIANIVDLGQAGIRRRQEIGGL